jgi:hypothetical protein
MGKKKRQRSIGLPAQWSASDEISLLSWLNFTLKHDELDFNETIVGYLKQVYRLSQVESKLRSIWELFGPVQEPGDKRKTKWRDDLFTHGSSCLHEDHGISDDVKHEIKILVQILEDEYQARQLSTPVRRLRSSSRLDERTPLGETTSAIYRSSFSRTPNLQRHKQSESLTPSTIKRESENLEVNDSGNGGRSKRLKKSSNKVPYFT